MSGTAVQARTDKLFRKLSTVLGQVASGTSPEAVHQLRTTVRRIETLIHTHVPHGQSGTAKLTKQLARLRRRAGRLRDIDVQLVALRSVRIENSSRDKSLVVRHLADVRGRRAKKLVRALHQELDSGLKRRMKRVEGVLTTSSSQAAESRDYTAEALLRFRELVRHQPALGEDNLHEFRKDCKRIRYVAEMGGEAAAKRRVVSELRRMQDAIGEWHDWLTLTELAAELLPTGNPPLLAALRAQRRVKLNEALRVAIEVRERLLSKRTRTPKGSRRKLAA